MTLQTQDMDHVCQPKVFREDFSWLCSKQVWVPRPEPGPQAVLCRPARSFRRRQTWACLLPAPAAPGRAPLSPWPLGPLVFLH